MDGGWSSGGGRRRPEHFDVPLHGCEQIATGRWRGNRRSRERREYLIDLVRRAAINMHDEYADWDRAMRNLQTLSLQGRLLRLSTANLRQLIEPPPAAGTAAGEQAIERLATVADSETARG